MGWRNIFGRAPPGKYFKHLYIKHNHQTKRNHPVYNLILQKKVWELCDIELEVFHIYSTLLFQHFFFSVSFLNLPPTHPPPTHPPGIFGSPHLTKATAASLNSSPELPGLASRQCTQHFCVYILWDNWKYHNLLKKKKKSTTVISPKQLGKLPGSSSISNCLGIFSVCAPEAHLSHMLYVLMCIYHKH